MNTSYSFTDAHRLLIKPFERLEFIVVFILITGLSQILALLVFSQPTFDLLFEKNQMQYGIATGIISGVFTGASQWLILRKYLLDWKWILVTGLSITFVRTIQTASAMWRDSLLSSFNGVPGQDFLWRALLLFSLASIGSVLISGYLQWYALRPYITKARWWIFIPLIAVLVGGVPLVASLSFGLLRLNADILNLTVMPATQAIGFCILKKRSPSDHPILQSPLALALDIVNYWDIKKLQKILNKRISRIWKTDLETSIGQLTYFVGVNRSGDVITYEPMDQASIDNIDETPLPELAREFDGITLKAGDLTSCAKFQFLFTPPGMVKISSWRGISLIWLGVSIYVVIMGSSVLCDGLKIDVLPFGK